MDADHGTEEPIAPGRQDHHRLVAGDGVGQAHPHLGVAAGHLGQNALLAHVVDHQMSGGRVRSPAGGAGWSQKQLAQPTGLRWTYVSWVERGERNILKVAEAVSVDSGTLLEGLRS